MMGLNLKLTPMGNAISRKLIGQWLHPRGAIDYFGVEKRHGAVSHFALLSMVISERSIISLVQAELTLHKEGG